MSDRLKCRINIDSIRSFSKGQPVEADLMDVVVKLLINSSNCGDDINYLGSSFYNLLKSTQGNKEAILELARTYKSSYYYGFDRLYTVVTYFTHRVWLTAIIYMPEHDDLDIENNRDMLYCLTIRSVNSNDRSTKGFLQLFIMFMDSLWSITRAERQPRNFRLDLFVKRCPPVAYAPDIGSSGLYMLYTLEKLIVSQFKNKIRLIVRANSYGSIHRPSEHKLRQDLLVKLYNLSKSNQLAVYQFFNGIGSRPFLGNILNLK